MQTTLSSSVICEVVNPLVKSHDDSNLSNIGNLSSESLDNHKTYIIKTNQRTNGIRNNNTDVYVSIHRKNDNVFISLKLYEKCSVFVLFPLSSLFTLFSIISLYLAFTVMKTFLIIFATSVLLFTLFLWYSILKTLIGETVLECNNHGGSIYTTLAGKKVFRVNTSFKWNDIDDVIFLTPEDLASRIILKGKVCVTIYCNGMDNSKGEFLCSLIKTLLSHRQDGYDVLKFELDDF